MNSRVLFSFSFLICCCVTDTSAADVASRACDASPETMRAVVLDGFGGPEQLRVDRIAVPSPERGEVLVRVEAAAVNPIDWMVREREYVSGTETFPMILGRDISGHVVARGPDSGDWQCGDAVVAFLVDSRQGGYAEYVPVKIQELARAPAGLSAREAAAFPLVATTAWQALFDHGKLAAGERVLIHGGAGGVGSLAIQLAKRHGATVVATASARNHDYLRSLGADEVIDYKTQRFEHVARDIDLVFDTIGGDTLTRSLDLLDAGGRLVSITQRPPKSRCEAEGIACSAFNAVPDARVLQRISDAFETGELRVNIDAVFPLEQAAQAQERNRTGRTRGKIVLDVRDAAARGAESP